MKKDDFRHMRCGKQLAALSEEDVQLLKPVEQFGKKKNKALLLLHGFSSSPAVYRLLIPKLPAYDAIVCPALPGHAESIEAFSQVKAADWLAASEKACQSLIKDYKQVDVLGLSLGGLLACHLGKKFDLNHLYLLAPALALHLHLNTSLGLAKFCQKLGFRQFRNAAGNLVNEQATEISYRRLPISNIIEILSLIQNFEWLAPSCPVDLFLGAQDKVVNSEKVSHLFDKLPKVKTHWLANSAHVLPLDNDLDAIIGCIEKQFSAS